MRLGTIKSILLYAGIGREEYSVITPIIWKNNVRTLRIAVCITLGMGLLFLIPNLILRPDYSLPYVILFLGSLLTHVILLLTRHSDKQSLKVTTLLCYGYIFLIFLSTCLLSMLPVNYDVPGVSVIVFISLLPLTIDDRPVRMIVFIVLECVIYAIASYYTKNARVFSGDLQDVLAFGIVAIVLYTAVCMRKVREIYQSVRIEKIQKKVISSLAAVVEERDENTGGHIMRCEAYTEKLLARMKTQSRYSFLTEEYCNYVVMAAVMHDIGKVKIPDYILNKPGRLTEEEFEIMKKHSEYGAEIILKTMGDVEEKEYITIACNIARSHHERYDGKGYPDRLKGESIPLEARIMALADVYDALISERVYKEAFSEETAKQIIREGSGTQFDPSLVQLFLECV